MSFLLYVPQRQACLIIHCFLSRANTSLIAIPGPLCYNRPLAGLIFPA
jgi:hypothetical protein